MSKLAVVSYPTLEAADREWIETFRTEHDPQSPMIPAHVTLVFPADAVAADVRREVQALADRSSAIPVVLRWARPVRDAFSAGGHVFLVPDEGFDAITALHDDLYRTSFAPSRRLHFPFIPHVTVAANGDFDVCERLARRLTPLPRLAHGRLESLDLIQISHGIVTSLDKFPLRG